MTPGQFSAGSSFNGNGGPAVFYPSGANRSALTFLGGFLKSALDNRECCGWSATQPRSVGKVKTRFANRLRGGLVHDNTIRRINSFACARSKRRRAAALQDASRPASHNLSRQRLGVRPALWRFSAVHKGNVNPLVPMAVDNATHQFIGVPGRLTFP